MTEGEISAITLGTAFGLMALLGFCWFLQKHQRSRDHKEGWSWQNLEKTDSGEETKTSVPKPVETPDVTHEKEVVDMRKIKNQITWPKWGNP